MKKLLNNNRGFTLTEVMVSVGLVGALAVVNMSMFSENMKSQRSATEQAASTRAFQSMIALLQDRDVCTRFLGIDNPDFSPVGEELPGPFVDINNNPRRNIGLDRVIRIPNGNVIMYQADGSAIATEPKVFEGKLRIGVMILESYRASGTAQETVKLGVLFRSVLHDFYSIEDDLTYPHEAIINITSYDDSGTQRIQECWAGN